MGHHHKSHNHHHSSNKIGVAFLLNLSLFILELIGGFLTNSVVLIANAIHDIGDSLSLLLAWGLEKFSLRQGDEKYSFGYRRFSLLSSLITGGILILGSVFVLIKSANRIITPEKSNETGLLIFALLGCLINLVAMFSLLRNKEESSNIRIVGWHLLEDALSWIVILILAVVNLFLHWVYLDPLASILITLYILQGVIREVWRVMTMFLQKNLSNVSLEELTHEIEQVNGVKALHHLHIWSLDDTTHILTSHLVIKDIALTSLEAQTIKQNVRKLLKDKYSISHITLELEGESEQEACLTNEENPKCFLS